MGEEIPSTRTDQVPSKRCAKAALCILKWSMVGLVVGGMVGLVGFPALGRLTLPPGYEIRPWDGQTIGEGVGMLVGLYVALKRC